MTAKLKASVSLLTLGVALASGSALAYEKGDMILRVGAAMVAPDEDSSVLNAGGNDVPGTSVTVDDETQLGLTGVYMLSNNIGVEVVAATPFTHMVSAKGVAGVDEVAEVKHLPPTVALQYFPMSSDSAFQPYVGLGLNYTLFFDEEATSAFKAATGDSDIDVDLDDSIGFAFQLGCDYGISDNLVLNAAIWKIDIDTSATIKTDSPFGTINVDVDIDPMVYMLGVGYKF